MNQGGLIDRPELFDPDGMQSSATDPTYANQYRYLNYDCGYFEESRQFTWQNEYPPIEPTTECMVYIGFILVKVCN